ncbi:MAG: TRAP transporter small permease [Oscillospiraceae bacterium]|nr:TRAP transporter small permease [Oscillospiraceae bacterium]
MYNGLVKLNDGIFKVYKVIMMILLALMSIWVFLEVIFRETGVSVPWIEEFTIYAFSWLTYFGAANVLRKDGHLSVTAVTAAIQKKSPKARKVIAVISYVIVLIFCIVVCYYSTQMVIKYLQRGSTTTNVRWIKMGWIFIQIPINYLVYILLEIEKIWGVITGKREAV